MPKQSKASIVGQIEIFPPELRSDALHAVLSLLDRMPAVVWATDPQTTLTSLAGAALATGGISAERYLGSPAAALFPSAAAANAHRKALNGSGSLFHAEWNGRNLEAQVQPLRNPAGQVAGVLGVALDVTERQMAETALRLSEQSYRSLIEDAPYAMCRATESGQLLQVNRAMLEMLGYDPSCETDLLVRDLPQIYADPETFEILRTALKTGIVHGHEGVWVRIDARPVQVRVGGRAAFDSAGRILHLDLIAENVTERKDLEARLHQAQKMQAVGQLAGGIAHDFNNLLTVINGYCDLLLASQAPDSGERESLELIRQAGERATNLTKQLLAFSRKQVTQTRPVHLNTLVSEVLKFSRRLIGENIMLVELLADNTGHVLADPAQIHQMLLNLVINARDAMAGGGRLTVTTARISVGDSQAPQLDLAPGEYILITVTDTGIGMDKSVLDRLFEPFFTTKPAGRGTGLGLSTVYGIVRQSRGAIAVDSFPGAGSTFRVYLPHYSAGTHADDGPQAPQLVRGASTILLVEDENAVRHFAATVLSRSGYTVLQASNAEDALSLAEHYPEQIHLLFTDIVMPGMSGPDLVRRFSAIRGGSKVLLTSGYSEALAANESLDPSINYLAKPFSAEQLTRVVERVLSTE